MVVRAGIGKADAQRDDIEETRRRQLDAEIGVVVADGEVEFVDAGLQGRAFEQRRIATPVSVGHAGDEDAARLADDVHERHAHARAGLGSDMAAGDDAWQDVSVRASVLPEDMQGVFMMIARAAKEGLPCPGDATIARAYGSHSLRRARRLLSYIEEQGLIVCQLDGAGRRTVTLVELAWATAPGDPNAEDAAIAGIS